jgi:hypothetical protein
MGGMDGRWWAEVGLREQWEQEQANARTTALDSRDTDEKVNRMAIIAADNGGNFKPVPQGVHLARCYRVIDLGTQEVEYQGDVKAQHKIMLGWELFGEDETGAPLLTDDGQPLVISKRYTLSLSKNARLRTDLESWRGRAFSDQELKGFDVSALVDKWCMVNVVHDHRDGKTFSNIVSISPVPAMLRNARPAGVNRLQVFDVTQPDMEVFGGFHDKLREIIERSFEWRAQKSPPSQLARHTATAGDVDEITSDCPF